MLPRQKMLKPFMLEAMPEATPISTLEDAQAPYFQGHFPNDAILPGIEQLLRAERVADPNGTKSLRTLQRIKFQHAIRPGETTQLSLTRGAQPGDFRFTHANAENTVCSTGSFSLTDTLASEPNKVEIAIGTQAFPPFETFMPHRAPMLWLDRMLFHTPERVVVERTLRGNHLGIQNGRASNAIAMELFAQAASAHFGFLAMTEGGGQHGGALLGTRRIDIFTESLPLDVPLWIEGSVTLTMPPLAQFACRLVAGELLLAEGTINVAMGVGA